MSQTVVPRTPLSDAIIIALAKLVDDAQSDRREPSHSDIEFAIQQCGLVAFDPIKNGQVVGKAKRVRAVLYRALEESVDKGERFSAQLIAVVRGCGGFRKDSPNFVGEDSISVLSEAIRSEGFELSSTGEVLSPVLENLSVAELSKALAAYVRRAKRGIEDAALLVGTGKDLLEATAAHVVVSQFGKYSVRDNFPTLLGQAFVILGMATTADPVQPGETPIRKMERSLYEAGCSVNSLRNKQGTGHGRPWISTVSSEQARTAVEIMGVVSEYLLVRLNSFLKSRAA